MEKKQRLWREGMKGEEGIGALHDLFFTEMATRSFSSGQVAEMHAAVKAEIQETIPSGGHQLALNGVSEVQASKFLHVDLEGRGHHKPMVVPVGPNDTEEAVVRLLETAAVVTRLSVELLKDPSFSSWDVENLSVEKRSAFRDSFDLDSPKEVLIDNIQTTLDVFRAASYGIDSVSGELQQFAALVSIEKPYYDSIAQETQLQQCGSAPFGFWAETRKAIPVAYKTEKVVSDAGGFSGSFLWALKNEEYDTGDLVEVGENARHGRCPALQPDMKSADYVNKMGKLFMAWHERLHGQA